MKVYAGMEQAGFIIVEIDFCMKCWLACAPAIILTIFFIKVKHFPTFRHKRG